MISASIEVKGPERDLHSGNEGGAAASTKERPTLPLRSVLRACGNARALLHRRVQRAAQRPDQGPGDPGGRLQPHLHPRLPRPRAAQHPGARARAPGQQRGVLAQRLPGRARRAAAGAPQPTRPRQALRGRPAMLPHTALRVPLMPPASACHRSMRPAPASCCGRAGASPRCRWWTCGWRATRATTSTPTPSTALVPPDSL